MRTGQSSATSFEDRPVRCKPHGPPWSIRLAQRLRIARLRNATTERADMFGNSGGVKRLSDPLPNERIRSNLSIGAPSMLKESVRFDKNFQAGCPTAKRTAVITCSAIPCVKATAYPDSKRRPRRKNGCSHGPNAPYPFLNARATACGYECLCGASPRTRTCEFRGSTYAM